MSHESGKKGCNLGPERERPGQPEFDAILQRSVEEGLRHVLGESGLQLVLSLYPLERISSDPAALHEALKDIFMASGAAIIEREVSRRLLESVGNEANAGARHRRSWLASVASHEKSSGQVSRREKEVLRQFLALESPARGGHAEGEVGEITIEMTAANFAYAFKRGP
jgi:hypothetical protein